MSKHTPGPWSVPHSADEESGCSCGYVFSESQRGFGAVATVPFGGEDENYPLAKANAKLIAAAPDLLEALQPFLDFADRELDLHGDVIPESIIEAARAAIAKAKGEECLEDRENV